MVLKLSLAGLLSTVGQSQNTYLHCGCHNRQSEFLLCLSDSLEHTKLLYSAAGSVYGVHYEVYYGGHPKPCPVSMGTHNVCALQLHDCSYTSSPGCVIGMVTVCTGLPEALALNLILDPVQLALACHIHGPHAMLDPRSCIAPLLHHCHATPAAQNTVHAEATCF